MNLSRIFANAFARRIAYVVVALVLAWMGIGQARAQAGTCTSDNPVTCSQGAAYSACHVSMDLASARRTQLGYTGNAGQCTLNVNLSAYLCVLNGHGCNEWTHLSGSWHYWKPSESCASRPSSPTLFEPPGGSFNCNNGCERKYTAMGLGSDGKMHTMQDYTGQVCNADTPKANCDAKNPAPPAAPTYVYNKLLGVCQPITVQCQDGYSPKEGVCALDESCPLGMVLNVKSVCVKESNDCPAGETKGPDGSCINTDEKNSCGTGKAKGKDGTCKKDANDDGTPDDEEGNEDGGKFSGGDNCDVPPSCSGDVIACGQARIQWRIDCNTRRNTGVNGGSCAAMPVCAGKDCKPVEMASLWQQWKTACELEKLNAKAPAGEGGEGETVTPGAADYEIQGLTEEAAGDAGEGGDGPDGIFTDGSNNNGGAGGEPGGTGELDADGYGWSRSCPTIPSVSVFGTTVVFDIGPVCDWISLGGMIVMIMGALAAVRILAGGTGA